MAEVAQPQPQQTGTPEMWDDINKKSEEKNVGNRISGNQNWMMKFFDDFSYLCLFTAEWITIKWICNTIISSDENIKDAKVIVKKDENDSSAKHGSNIALQEEDKKVKTVTPTSTPWDENTKRVCQNAEASIPPVTATTSSAPTM